MSDKDREKDTTGSGSRISNEDFETACAEYEANEKSLVEIADELGVSRQALSARFKRAGVVKGSKAKGRTEEKQAPTGYSANRSQWIEDARVNGYNALKQAQLLARKIVVDAAKSGRSVETVDGELRAMQRYNKTLVDNITATLRILDADNHIDEADLPQLVIEDLTDEQILEHHKSTGALSEDATIDDLNAEEIVEPSDLEVNNL